VLLSAAPFLDGVSFGDEVAKAQSFASMTMGVGLQMRIFLRWFYFSMLLIVFDL